MPGAPELLELIELAIHRNNFTSDAQLDAAMLVENKVYRWRKGQFLPSDDLMRRLAQLAGRDPDEALALLKALDAEKHAQPASAVAWRGIMKRLAAVTVLVPMMLALVPGFGSYPAHAAEPQTGGSVYYVPIRRPFI